MTSLIKRVVGASVVGVGGTLSRLGRRLLLSLQAHDRPDIPVPIHVAEHTFDVVDDLAAYTTLRRHEVERLLRRETDSFRVEWHTLEPKPQNEIWFYLSTRTYLFGNAIHFHETPELVAAVMNFRSPPARVLDFGAGTGNLALALAASGLQTDAMELSALQKDFLRFRSARHGIEVRILDWWDPDGLGTYDLICAFDVLEHLHDLQSTLEARLLPSLAPGGLFVERSPFIRNFSNPMHHEDVDDLDGLLVANGLTLVEDADLYRLWVKDGESGDSPS